MTDAELVEFATEFRRGILGQRDSSRSMCFAVAWPLGGLLAVYGIETELVESDLGNCNHIWLRLADGRALDPTADQFDGLNLPPVYLGKPDSRIHKTQRKTARPRGPSR